MLLGDQERYTGVHLQGQKAALLGEGRTFLAASPGPLPLNSAGPQLVLVLPPHLMLTCCLSDPTLTKIPCMTITETALLLRVGLWHFSEISPEEADHSGQGIDILQS